ncbi:MAG: hypothetical protein ITG02_02220 [Patulibacter sp.]|nr:hypothetical protein [Patulibacter sp.]
MITDEFVRQVTEDLRARYELDADGVRQLGARIADAERDARSGENREFAARFTERHHATFDRLAR